MDLIRLASAHNFSAASLKIENPAIIIDNF